MVSDDGANLPSALRAVYPWAPHWLSVPGGRLHYLDEGPESAEPLLCLHGNPTWSFYWRQVVQRFGGPYRVVALDHLGCGLSDKPQDWSYRLADHVENAVALVDHLDLRDLTLVLHDWGGAIGMGLAAARPERIARLVVTNTAAFRSRAIPASIASVRVPGFGALAVRGGNAFARVATWRAVHRPLDPVARQGLLHPYDSWANRIATLRFVQDIPLAPGHPSYDTLKGVEDALARFVDRPMLLCWGDDDFCFTPAFRAEWSRRFPAAEVHAWSDVGHYVCEDAPERLLAAMASFLERHPVGGPLA
jgi:cis-3-alkyl-4-acyloxetan-2-one decarboxylase